MVDDTTSDNSGRDRDESGARSAPESAAQPPPPPPPPAQGPPPLPDPGVPAAPPPLPDEGPAQGADEASTHEAGGITFSADDAAAEEVRERALRHATEQTRTYPCRRCGGELEFNITDQKLKCPQCGNIQDIIEDEGREVVEQDFGAALAAIREGAINRTGVQVSGEKEVVCQNCGGHTTFTGTLTATRCPYCATPIQRDDVHDAPSRLAVDGVLPFRVDDQQAEENIKKWISSRWFAPNEFKKYGRAGSFNSVYAAYFTYDSSTTTRYSGMRGDTYTVTVGHGENRRTEVRVRWTPRSGVVENGFDDVPILANTGFDRRYISELEPWPTQSAKPFSAEYLAGHLSRTYDHDVEQSFGTAKQRMEDAVRSTVRGAIGGDQQRIHSMNVRYNFVSYKHLLLPIWLLTVIYAQTTYQVFMNGVTGEVHGQRPYSKLKIALAVLAALIVAGIGFYLYSRSGNSESTPTR